MPRVIVDDLEKTLDALEGEARLLEKASKRLAEEYGPLEDASKKLSKPFCHDLKAKARELVEDFKMITARVRRARLLLDEYKGTGSLQKLAAANHTVKCGW